MHSSIAAALLLSVCGACSALADDDGECRGSSGDAAIVACTRAIVFDRPHSSDLVRAYHLRGRAFFARDEKFQALRDYNAALWIDPGASDVYVDRGALFADRGDLDLALTNYEVAIKTGGDGAEPYVGRGLAHYDRGDFVRALADLETALERSPDLAKAHRARGLVLKEMGEKERALSDFLAAVRLDPKDVDAAAEAAALRKQGVKPAP